MVKAETLEGARPCRHPLGNPVCSLVVAFTLLASQAHARDLLISPVGEAPNDRFGSSANGIGDFNSDGFSDIVVGAPNWNSGVGRAYVLYGSSNPDETFNLVLQEASGSLYFGDEAEPGGDINGDNRDDFLIGAPGGGADHGHVYAYFGGISPDTMADLVLVGQSPDDGFGERLGGGGDFNGDGFDDILVGATTNDAGGAGAGAAYVFYGGTDPDAQADMTLLGENSNDQFGAVVTFLGDINRDTYDDIAVASILFPSGLNRGKVYVYLGGANPSTTPAFTMTGTGMLHFFGNGVAGIGDFNDDGYDDFVVGEPGWDGPGTQRGRAHFYLGKSSPIGTADMVLLGDADNQDLGARVAGAGNVNDDSFDDVFIWRRTLDRDPMVVFGNGINDILPDWNFHGPPGSETYGTRMQSAGDMNGDQIDDYLISDAKFDGGSGLWQGAVYVHAGIPRAGQPAFVYTSLSAEEYTRSNQTTIEPLTAFNWYVLSSVEYPFAGFEFTSVVPPELTVTGRELPSGWIDTGQPNPDDWQVGAAECLSYDGVPEKLITYTGMLLTQHSDVRVQLKGYQGPQPVGPHPNYTRCGFDFNDSNNPPGTPAFDEQHPILGWPHNSILINPSVTSTTRLDEGQTSVFLGVNPNPFSASTSFHVRVTREGAVLSIHDLAGRLVCETRFSSNGDFTWSWSGRDKGGHQVANGVYLARLDDGVQMSARRVVLLR